jgi:hypothetical protein
VGKKYGSKGYPQGNAAHMGSISCMWISFALDRAVFGTSRKQLYYTKFIILKTFEL